MSGAKPDPTSNPDGVNPRAINPLQGAAGQETIWTRTFRPPDYPPLRADATTEVCVVGAGIAGLSVAYQLAQSGASVMVLDDGAIGSGMTSRTTAHLADVIDDRFAAIERMHGEEVMRLAAESHEAAIDEIERIVDAEKMDCDFERLPGYLFLPPGGRIEDLDGELERARRVGLSVTRVERIPLDRFDTGPALRFEGQGVFHPLKYLGGLAEAIVRRGGRIHPATRVTAWDGGSPAKVRTASGATVTADFVVFATNTPINDRVVIHNKQAPYLTHVIVAKIAEGAVPFALYWDLDDPYHYVRLVRAMRDEDRGSDLIMVGGDDYKTGQADRGEPFRAYSRLEEWARARFTGMRDVVLRWSGQVMEPVDGLAYIGRNPLDERNVFVVTGDSGQGLTHGTIAGILIRDLIQGQPNPWTSIYDPARKPTSALGAYARENLNVAAQFLKYFTPGDASSVDAIPPDCGAVIRHGLTKHAVYRDTSGELHEMSATCPHLGCLVNWNHAERTWDCPCHGSRFDAVGKVISGPANTGLASVTEHAAKGNGKTERP